MSPSHYFLVALEFYRFELKRGPVRFFAEMQNISPPPAGTHLAIIPTPEFPGVGNVFDQGRHPTVAAWDAHGLEDKALRPSPARLTLK
jgi:hypothetical protein